MAERAEYISGEGYSELDLASAFIRHLREVDHLKLQKLCYFAHGWSLAFYDRPLVRHPFQAWKYGPVLPGLYQALKRFGARDITEDDAPSKSEILEEDMKVVRLVAETFGSLPASKLVSLTHATDGPWRKFYSAGDRSTVIPDSEIADYFKRLRSGASRHG